MLPSLGAVALAFGAIFIAEFGDTSQLLILAFATRYAARPVVLELVLAAAIVQGISVAVGAAAGGRCRCLRPRVPGGRRLDPAR